VSVSAENAAAATSQALLLAGLVDQVR